MKTNILSQSFITNKEQGTKSNDKYFFFKRFSPFVILAPVLIILCPFIIIDAGKNELVRVILLPFIIANTVYADFALRKYFKSGKRLCIWIIESIISALIIYWIV